MSGPVLRACGASIGVTDTAHARRRSGDRAGAGRPRGGSGTPRGRAAIAGPTLEHPGYRGLRHGRIARPDRHRIRALPEEVAVGTVAAPAASPGTLVPTCDDPTPRAQGHRTRRVGRDAPMTASGRRLPATAFPVAAVGNDPEADSRAPDIILFVRFDEGRLLTPLSLPPPGTGRRERQGRREFAGRSADVTVGTRTVSRGGDGGIASAPLMDSDQATGQRSAR